MENLAVAKNMPAQSSFVRRLSLRKVAIAAFFAVLWLGLWSQLSGEWSLNEQYNYGWFVPFFAIVLFWLRLEDAPAPVGIDAVDGKLTGKFIAAALIVIALLLLFPIRLFEIGNPDWRPVSWLHALCVVTITFVFLWQVGGRTWLRHFAFPVAFTLVAVPWISVVEIPVIQGLMRLIAAVAAETANLLGIPAQVQGNLIRIRTGLVGVNEACSGVRSLQTSLMIGLLFGELKRLSTLRRAGLVAGAIAISLVANVARTLFLVWVGESQGIPAIAHWHDLAGYAIVVLVFIGSLLLAILFARHKKSDAGRPKSDVRKEFRISRVGFGIAAAALVWLVLTEIATAGWYRAHERDLVVMPQWSVKWQS